MHHLPEVHRNCSCKNFLVNFSGSTVWKGLLFVHASACYDKAVYTLLHFTAYFYQHPLKCILQHLTSSYCILLRFISFHCTSLYFTSLHCTSLQGGRWECHCKYIEENWLVNFDSMKFSDRCFLAVVALSDFQEVMAARIHLLVHCMWKKKLKQFCSIYLQWHSQRPSCNEISYLSFHKIPIKFP